MATVAFHTLGGIQIPRGLIWQDEMEWQAVEHVTERSVTGALLVDTYVKTAGRPITLVAAEDAGWKGMTRAKVLAVKALADTVPSVPFTFKHADGREFTVIFAPGETPIEARPLARPELPPSDYPYIATIRLVTV